MRKLLRVECLPPEEAERYNRIREKIEQEFPHLIKRHDLRMSTYVLVKYSDNWADELDVDGFRVMTKEEYNDWRTKVEAKTGFYECYFGTNESIEYDGPQSYLANISVLTITEAEYNVLANLFPNLEFGTFINLLDYGYDE